MVNGINYSLPRPCLNRGFLALFIHGHKGNPGLEEDFIDILVFPGAESADVILYRGSAEVVEGNHEAHDFSELYGFSEDDIIKGNREKVVAGKLLAGSDIGKLIYPLEGVAAEQFAVVVQMFRENQLVILHKKC